VLLEIGQARAEGVGVVVVEVVVEIEDEDEDEDDVEDEDVVEELGIAVEEVEDFEVIEEEVDVEFAVDCVALTEALVNTVELPVEEVGTKVLVVVLPKKGILLVDTEDADVVAFALVGSAVVVTFPAMGTLLLFATSVLLNENTERRLLSPQICELLPAQLIPHATSTSGPKDCVAMLLPQKHSTWH
jgi:hypothetical protein